jgi:hypothetical protein
VAEKDLDRWLERAHHHPGSVAEKDLDRWLEHVPHHLGSAAEKDLDRSPKLQGMSC